MSDANDNWTTAADDDATEAAVLQQVIALHLLALGDPAALFVAIV